MYALFCIRTRVQPARMKLVHATLKRSLLPYLASSGDVSSLQRGLQYSGAEKEGHRLDCIRVMKANNIDVREVTSQGWPAVPLHVLGRAGCTARRDVDQLHSHLLLRAGP